MKRTLVVMTAVLLLAACATTSGPDEARVEQVGRYVVDAVGPEVEVVVGYRYAANHIGSDWLLLDLAVTGFGTPTTELDRADISITTPDGRDLPLATQEEFGNAYGRLQTEIRAAEVSNDPLEYFPGNRQPCGEWVFVQPGAGLSWDTIQVNNRTRCSGFLFFEVPGGVASGDWTLHLVADGEPVEIPFTLPAADGGE